VHVPILMYHSVADRPPASTRGLAVRPGALVEQFGHLRDAGFTPLTFADLVVRLRDGEPALPARPVVITFDDGYADFHTEALPILEQFGFAATVFVTTGWLADAGPHAAGRPLDRTLTWSVFGISSTISSTNFFAAAPTISFLPTRTPFHRKARAIRTGYSVVSSIVIALTGHASAAILIVSSVSPSAFTTAACESSFKVKTFGATAVQMREPTHLS